MGSDAVGAHSCVPRRVRRRARAAPWRVHDRTFRDGDDAASSSTRVSTSSPVVIDHPMISRMTNSGLTTVPRIGPMHRSSAPKLRMRSTSTRGKGRARCRNARSSNAESTIVRRAENRERRRGCKPRTTPKRPRRQRGSGPARRHEEEGRRSCRRGYQGVRHSCAGRRRAERWSV